VSSEWASNPSKLNSTREILADPAALRERLGAYLSERIGTKVVILDLVKYPVGFSWITYGARVRQGESDSSEMILRLGPPYGLYAPYSAFPQFEVLKALGSSAVPVPQVYYASDDPSILGAPFFLCEKVAGHAPVPWGGRDSAELEPERRDKLATDFMDALIALHQFEWRSTGLRAWDDGLGVENVAPRQLDHWYEQFQRWALRPHPMAHYAFAWLREREPKAPRVAIVHGDYRLGNFLARNDRITAILDWELVHLGDPVEDLGWAFLPQYRGGSRLVCGLIEEDEFLRRYQAKMGYSVDRDSLKFYFVFSLLKLALTHMAAARCFESGQFDDMRMPAMATQIAPVFRQIEKALERSA
jgi:aminoglycoside phosphotransferase (APT) family kinase protein